MLFLSWLAILAMLTSLGLENGVIRVLPSYLHNEDWEAANGVKRLGIILPVTVGVGVSIVWIFIISMQNVGIIISYKWSVWSMVLLLPMVATSNVLANVLRAMRHIVLSQGIVNVVEPLSLITFLIFVYLSQGYLDVRTAIICKISALVLVLLLLFLALRRNWPTSNNRRIYNIKPLDRKSVV